MSAREREIVFFSPTSVTLAPGETVEYQREWDPSKISPRTPAERLGVSRTKTALFARLQAEF